MRFRWEWLEPVIRAPHVPTLGPVAPDVLCAALFDAVVGVAGTERFLPFDTDRRWFEVKSEYVLVEGITHRPGITVIPTLATGGRGLVRIYHYGEDRPDIEALTELGYELCAAHNAGKHRIVWFQATPEGARTRLLLKTFSPADRRDESRVVELTRCRHAGAFPAFAREVGPEGFTFLCRRMEEGVSDGPVLVTVEDDRIVGALGPLAVLTDANGTRMQTPQYFAVHPDYRGRGHGRTLWRASMNWGLNNGAVYKVLQAAYGGPAERLYLSEALRTLGFLCATD